MARMRKRKAEIGNSNPKTTRKKMEKERSETLNSPLEQEEEEEKGKAGKGFYACYLLTSLCPRFKGHTYIGFTVNPRRRIRQHNGEIRSGAFRTKKRRPWEMVFCIYGFPTNVSALQFEWAWQHPMESLAVRRAAATFKSFSGVANKIKLACTMLNLPAWQSLNITVNYFSTKYTMHSAGCPSLPEHMKVQVCPMDELLCYTETGETLFEGGDTEDAADGEEEYKKASNASGIAGMSMLGLQACSGDELQCYNAREESSFEGGNSENYKSEEEEDSKASSNTSGSVKETNADMIVHISEDYYAHSIDENPHEQFGWFDEYSKKEQRDPTTPEVEYVQPFGVINSLLRTASSVDTSFSKREIRDGVMLTLINENPSELDWLRGEKITRDVAGKKDQQPIHSLAAASEIEVIDLLSPSPECRIRSICKNRSSTVCSEIIDLT